MQDATDTMAALHEVTTGSVMEEEAAVHVAPMDRPHTSPRPAFDFESLLLGPSQLPDLIRQPIALEQPQIRHEAPVAMPGQDALGESSLLYHLSELQVRLLQNKQKSKLTVEHALTNDMAGRLLRTFCHVMINDFFGSQKPPTDAQEGLSGTDGHFDDNSAPRPQEGRAPKQARHIWQGPGLLGGEARCHSAVPVTGFNQLLTSHFQYGLGLLTSWACRYRDILRQEACMH